MAECGIITQTSGGLLVLSVDEEPTRDDLHSMNISDVHYYASRASVTAGTASLLGLRPCWDCVNKERN